MGLKFEATPQNTAGPKIDVEIGKLTFAIDASVENLERLAVASTEIGKSLENVEVETLDDIKKVLKKGFTLLFGKGAFKEIYAEVQSVVRCAEIFLGIVEALPTELEKVLPKPTQAQKAAQFVQKKNKKHKK